MGRRAVVRCLGCVVSVVACFGATMVDVGAVEPVDAVPTEERAREVAVPKSPAQEAVSSEVPVGRSGVDEAGEATRVKEKVDQRTATTESWDLSDGGVSMVVHSQPKYFQEGTGSEWREIDPSLVVDEDTPGRYRSAANRWSVSFGPSGDEGGLVSFVLSGQTLSFSPVGATPGVKPQIDGQSATYDDLWVETDVVYSVSASGVDERFGAGVGEGADLVRVFGCWGSA